MSKLVEWVKANPSQFIGFLFSFVGLVLMPAIAAIREEAELLGASPRVFIVLGAVMLAVTIAGRVWQKMRGSVPVTWGWSSALGFLSALVAEVMGVLQELSDALDPIGVPSAFWYSVGIALAAVTKVLRYAQAVEFGAGGPVIIAEPVPTEGGAGEPPVAPEF